MTMEQIRSLFHVGQVVTVTNHFINRPDHPCYGTRRRTIAKVNASSLTFTESGRVAWPNRSAVIVDGDKVQLFGGGIGQASTDLFLTIQIGAA